MFPSLHLSFLRLKGKYGTSLVVWDWPKLSIQKTIDLGMEGLMPLEVRFLHNPAASEGFVGCAIGSTVWRFFKTAVSLLEGTDASTKKR